MGAGDIIMSLVGTALTGLAFVIYKHRASISVPAVAGTALVSSVFSVMATMGASNILGVTAGALSVRPLSTAALVLHRGHVGRAADRPCKPCCVMHVSHC